MKQTTLALTMTASALVGSLLMAGTAFADTTTTAGPQGGGMGWGAHQGSARTPGVFGTVASINGSTITVTSKGFEQNPTTTTYTVDASSATVTKDGSASSVSAIVVGDNVAVQGTVSGDNVTATKINDGMLGGARPGVVGTVTAISGTSITLDSKGRGQNASDTTYTVDASNATVTKAGATSSVSAIAVGDTLMVSGTVSGTSVTATKINDGMGKGAGQTPAITGNGEPVVGGSITAINGSTLTVTNKSNITYTVDALSATIMKGKTTSSLTSLAVGDNVVIQGTVNGTSITASSVIDQGATPAAGSTSGSGMGAKMGGFFGAIGGFIQHLFGFF